MVRCFSCGGLAPDIEGPSHKYMLSSPGCWEVYGRLLARDYQEYGYPAAHRLSVDAYAVQHPGKPMRQAIQSVAVHLIGLYYSLERGLSPEQVTKAIGRTTQFSDRFVWLEPPALMGSITVVDAAEAGNLEAYQKAAREWAESAWEAWSSHHDRVRSWAAL